MLIAGNREALTASRSSVPPQSATLPGQEVSLMLRGYAGGSARGGGESGRRLKRGEKICAAGGDWQRGRGLRARTRGAAES
jgi:hypothetical protein